MIQIYNNLQGLWSSKVKFVSLSQLLGCCLTAANSGGLAQLFSIPDQHSGSLWPISPVSPGPIGSCMHPPPGCGCACTGPSMIHTLLCACGLRFLQLTLSPCFGFGLAAPHTSLGALGGQQGREETGAAAAGEFPQVSLRVFFFLAKSSCSILPLHKRKGLSSHTAHLSS